MRILHLLSQRPEATGSGIYIQAMIREAARRGHENFLLAGAPGEKSLNRTGWGPRPVNLCALEGGDLPSR